MAKSHSEAAQLRQLLRLFALFGHPVRVVIFQRLARAPSSAGELACRLPISRTAVVQHLKRLEAAGLVAAAVRSRRRIYCVRREGLAPLARWLAKHSHRDESRHLRG
jgi:DNA-binding transcriptional ArsR family regulator